jgi:hypothetical protein
MDNKLLDCQVNNICEAFGCFEKAATKIKVRVGHLGLISLDLCTDCTRKFDTEEQPVREESTNESK